MANNQIPMTRGIMCPDGQCRRSASWAMAILRWLFAGTWSLVIGHLLLGCTPQSTTRDAALDSRLFARAEVIGLRGTGLGQLTKPRSLALDRTDNLFVADMTGRIQKF